MKYAMLGASALALIAATPAQAQNGLPQDAEDNGAEEGGEIIVTAQRQAQSLQSVPIAVSAFSAEALEKQQIENSSDLQLTLPNITFTKTSFTSSSFTIRGVGDLCVGASCDQATAIHVNGSPLFSTRLFETEFFDLERIEVLRGPQGTLFGRNATSGVVNFVTAKPDLSGFKASGEAEYGNFNAYKVKGMVNVPVGETLAVRVAGYYLKRDGYTKNLFTGNSVDGRDMYGVRGSLRWEPTDSTKFELLGYYFREKDDRLRIQKQQCLRDPTGVLGCLPSGRGYQLPNVNASFIGTLSSREFLAIAGGAPGASLGLTSVYGPDLLASQTNPADPRVLNIDFEPQYFTTEQQYQARLEHDFGPIKAQLTGLYQKSRVVSRQDVAQAVYDRTIAAAGLANFAATAAGTNLAVPAAARATFATHFAPGVAALLPNGVAGQLCTSAIDPNGVGAFGPNGGNKVCGSTPLDFDQSSNGGTRSYSGELILSSDLDGRFNFLLGGIYSDNKSREVDYYVNNFFIDYISSVLGSLGSANRAALAALPGATPPAPSFQGPPFFRSNSPNFSVKSYGLFGEAYVDISDRLKLTLGGRYNNDKKSLSARSLLVNFLIPYGSATAFSSPFVNGFAVTGAPANTRLNPFDADQTTPCSIATTTASGILTAANTTGCDLFQVRNVKFNEVTGRAVLDFKITDRNLIYASYSRGYKSGGINPPLQPGFDVNDSFQPELIDAFEIGSKNSFGNGSFTINATAFYYKYKGLQLSRIVNRTSINDNIDANIYGLELESILRPAPGLTINMGASYLKTKVVDDTLFANPRDPSAGRSDVVIVKDLQNASNCTVLPTTAGNSAGVNQFVGAVNTALGLRAPAPFPTNSGITANGAFSICGQLTNAVANPSAGLRTLFNTPTGSLPFSVVSTGIAQSIRGNELPQAPNFKWNVGIQYVAELNGGLTLVPRGDLVYTGDSFGNIFNGGVNRIKGYSQINAQLQLNGRDDRWFVRGFIQNLTNNSAITGLGVGDQSQGVFTGIFTLEPRRYGLAAGFKF